MDTQEFSTLLETQLGGNLVDVELTPEDYEFCFSRAKKVSQQKGNNNFDENYYALSVTAGETVYTVDNTIDTIRDIIRPGSGFFTQNNFSYALFEDLFQGIRTIGSTSLLDYQMVWSYIEQVKRMTNFEIPYIWNKRTHVLKLLKAPPTTEQWFLHCFSDVDDNTYRDQLWIQEWSYAEALALLGRAYMKFQSIPSPAGDASLPGQDMIQESNDLKEKLLDDILNNVDGDPAGLPLLIY